jgi:hypothetical protein
MALTLKIIPEQHFDIGPSAGWRAFQATPAASDYATGGYLITPAQVGMYMIVGATVIGQKYAATGAVQWVISQPAASFGTTPVLSTTGVYLTALQSAASTGTIAIPVATNVGTTGPVYADTVANQFSTTGAATSITNATFTGAVGNFNEVAAGTDLSGFPLWILFIGY